MEGQTYIFNRIYIMLIKVEFYSMTHLNTLFLLFIAFPMK